jgi:hypothetical protein
MATLSLGIVLLICAAISLWDAARIASKFRLPGTFDIIGPDRYLMGIAIVIGILGISFIVDWIRKIRQPAGPRAATMDESAIQAAILAGGLLAYAIAMSVFGYIISTIVFSLGILPVMGMKNRPRIVLLALIITASFYLAFVKLAGMPLPDGIWNIG